MHPTGRTIHPTVQTPHKDPMELKSCQQSLSSGPRHSSCHLMHGSGTDSSLHLTSPCQSCTAANNLSRSGSVLSCSPCQQLAQALRCTDTAPNCLTSAELLALPAAVTLPLPSALDSSRSKRALRPPNAAQGCSMQGCGHSLLQWPSRLPWPPPAHALPGPRGGSQSCLRLSPGQQPAAGGLQQLDGFEVSVTLPGRVVTVLETARL